MSYFHAGLLTTKTRSVGTCKQEIVEYVPPPPSGMSPLSDWSEARNLFFARYLRHQIRNANSANSKTHEGASAAGRAVLRLEVVLPWPAGLGITSTAVAPTEAVVVTVVGGAELPRGMVVLHNPTAVALAELLWSRGMGLLGCAGDGKAGGDELGGDGVSGADGGGDGAGVTGGEFGNWLEVEA